ncbi:MAG: HlyD family efflux transporter periplasmic adaptor subunit [Planctomycetes bacterium]|nr:HlyD family efflux transporter periplasmic adaptor subunit [Planctomycetota bacterium]
MKKLSIGIGIAIVIFIGLIAFQKNRTLKANQTNGPVVRLETVQRGEFVEVVSAPGQIEPKTEVEISAKISGRILELPYPEGAQVTKGDPSAPVPIPPSVLVQLDAADMESQLRSAEATRDAQHAQIDVEKARIAAQKASLEGLAATVNRARLEYERQKLLRESRDISQAAFEQTEFSYLELNAQYESAAHNITAAELNLIVMEHNLQAAQARVDQARDTLSYTTITSPIDGIVTQLNAEVGEVVMTGTMNNPGTVIMKVADLGIMMLVAEVDEVNVGMLRIGQPARVRVQAFWDEEFEGTVESIALTHRFSSTGVKYYRTRILLSGDVQKLYTGLTGTVAIETQRHTGVLKVPTQAVLGYEVDILPAAIRDDNPLVNRHKTETPVVFRFIDGKAIVTPVAIGPSDLTHTLIRDGLSEGDRIIVGPYNILETLRHDANVRQEDKTDAVAVIEPNTRDNPRPPRGQQ